MKTIVDKNTGKELRCQFDGDNIADNEIAIDELRTVVMNNPYFNFQTREFYEGVYIEPIKEVPFEVQLWRIRTVLKLSSMEQVVEVALNALPEPTKTAALYVWNYGTTVERNSQTVQLLQSVLGLNESQVDDMFIQANEIVI